MQHYTLKAFLRTAPNELLAEYFKRAGWLSEIAFDKLKPRKIEPVFDAIQQLPNDARAIIDTDFQDITALSYVAGISLLLQEAKYHDLDFIEPFVPLKGHCAKAFWVFLNHKKVFENTLPLTCRDNLTGYWRKRNGLLPLNDADFSSKTKSFLHTQKITPKAIYITKTVHSSAVVTALLLKFSLSMIPSWAHWIFTTQAAAMP